MKEKLIKAHMRTAINYAGLSSAIRRQVGAILVKDDSIISIGYNGTLPGSDNTCEEKVYNESGQYEDEQGKYDLRTLPTTLHAEENCIAKVAKSTVSSVGAVMFITDSPCVNCSKLIKVAGISKVYYWRHYRDSTGSEFLQTNGVEVEQIDPE